VLVLIGLEDEHSWLPALLEVANNPKILLGRPGYIDCSIGVSVLEAPTLVDRSEGDLHPRGNPHYLLDPVRAKIVAQNIATGLSRNFPQYQATFEKNLKAYIMELITGSRAGKKWGLLYGASICRVSSGVDLSC
jgi:zinc/manganese transport system substrate-binding protein